jgi:hypothetical protein
MSDHSTSHLVRMSLAAALFASFVGTATARASSIVYIKASSVWVTGPNGKQHAKLTSGRKFASPSQADDGTIVALGADNHLYRFTHSGKSLGKPVATWLGLGGGNGFAGPYRVRVSPDELVAGGTSPSWGLAPAPRQP